MNHYCHYPFHLFQKLIQPPTSFKFSHFNGTSEMSVVKLLFLSK